MYNFHKHTTSTVFYSSSIPLLKTAKGFTSHLEQNGPQVQCDWIPLFIFKGISNPVSLFHYASVTLFFVLFSEQNAYFKPLNFLCPNIIFPDFHVTASFSLFRSEFKYHQLFPDHSSWSTTVPSTILFNPLHSTLLLQQTLLSKVIICISVCVWIFFLPVPLKGAP